MQPSSRSSRPANIARRFQIPGPVEGIEPLGKGLINDTFLVTARGSGWVLQRINEMVFPHPERIMANLSVLSEHLGRHPNTDLCIPALIPSEAGNSFVRDQDGAIWRLMELIPNAQVLTGILTPAQAEEVGHAIGRFHRLTADLAPNRLVATLPGFHVTPSYLDHFTEAVERAGDRRYSEEIREVIRFVDNRRGFAEVLETARRDGRLPVRVIHGDPKLDNILFDGTGTLALCLIDLDTVQPGLIHYDIGDCLRSCCNRQGESPGMEPGAELDLDICRGILEAYAGETRDLLTTVEVGLIFDAVRLLPFELGLRFITDHLEGDRYFRVDAPGQNLRKALVQLALVADIEAKEQKIRRIVTNAFEFPEATK